MTVISYGSLRTPRGVVYVARGERGLLCVTLPGKPLGRFLAEVRALAPGAEVKRDERAVAAAVRQLREYFAGRRRDFDLPLDVRVPRFTRAVLARLRRIPYGATASYGAVARAVGRPRAARAVGQACGRNPLPIVIPCHRVLAGDGSLGGFGGGLPLKRYLLRLERGATPARA